MQLCLFYGSVFLLFSYFIKSGLPFCAGFEGKVLITKVVYPTYFRRFVFEIRSVQNARLTLRRLMSYIYMEHPFLMFLDRTQRRSTVGRTPLDE